ALAGEGDIRSCEIGCRPAERRRGDSPPCHGLECQFGGLAFHERFLSWIDVNTPPASAGGFSDKLCRNRLARQPKAGSTPHSPVTHDLSRGNIAIQNTPAFAAVRPLAQGLRLNCPAFRAGLRGAARIDLDERATSLCSFVVEHRDQLRPCGVVYVAGEHSTRQPANVEVLDG